jgi:hypothetical protein
MNVNFGYESGGGWKCLLNSSSFMNTLFRNACNLCFSFKEESRPDTQLKLLCVSWFPVFWKTKSVVYPHTFFCMTTRFSEIMMELNLRSVDSRNYVTVLLMRTKMKLAWQLHSKQIHAIPLWIFLRHMVQRILKSIFQDRIYLHPK